MRALLEDMKAFFAEDDRLKRDAIAVRQLRTLQRYQNPRDEKLRLADIKATFEQANELFS